MTVLLHILLAVTLWTDSILFDAYQREDMSVWQEYINRLSNDQRLTTNDLLYEYGFCGYIVAEAKKEGGEYLLPEAKRYVQQFKNEVNRTHAAEKSPISNLQSQLPAGHYEMYMSAVYVYELRLHESIHPVKAMNLAKEATRLVPNDPLVLSYYATCLFYAPKPFGSKQEALRWFEKADRLFEGDEWKYCWVRDATRMYILQCQEKLKKH